MALTNSREKNFAEWYTELCLKAKLFSYGEAKGTINYLPYGWAIWKNIVHELDKRLKATGVLEVQLPLFIKASDFAKEKQHIEGFAPEAFTITTHNGQTLDDPLILRPTSEVLFSRLFKNEIKTYNDLPIKYNQWCSVYRMEKNTKPFLRGCEFFWHELHAMFQTQQECEEYTLKIHKLYNDFLKYVCCLGVLEGKKTESEKFAGAVDTYTREVLAQDGQCIQTGTSHYLGQNFAKMYDIKYQTNNNEFAVPYYMSAGLTTRLIGDLIVVHGDDKGLVLPSLLAPVQVAIISLFAKKEPLVETLCKQIYDSLNTNFRVEFDNSDEQFGYKITNQELRGVPITIAIGPNDAKNNKATMIRRDLGTKQLIDLDNIVDFIKQQLQEYNVNIYNKSKTFLQSSIIEVDNIDDFIKGINDRKVIKACWGGSIEDEAKLKEMTQATPRCIVTNANETDKCFFTKQKAKYIIYFAKAY